MNQALSGIACLSCSSLAKALWPGLADQFCTTLPQLLVMAAFPPKCPAYHVGWMRYTPPALPQHAPLKSAMKHLFGSPCLVSPASLAASQVAGGGGGGA